MSFKRVLLVQNACQIFKIIAKVEVFCHIVKGRQSITRCPRIALQRHTKTRFFVIRRRIIVYSENLVILLLHAEELAKKGLVVNFAVFLLHQ